MNQFLQTLGSLFILYLYVIICSILTIGFILILIYLETHYRHLTKKKIDKMSKNELAKSLLLDFFLIVTGFLIVNKLTKYILFIVLNIKDGLEFYHKEHFSACSILIVYILLHSPIYIRDKMTRLAKQTIIF